MNAARVGSLDAVTLLLDRGPTIDATDATYQQTALMVAVRENHPDIVKLLIARGASVQREDENRPRAAVDPAQLGAGLRARHRDRARRIAGARVARTDPWRDDSSALRRA